MNDPSSDRTVRVILNGTATVAEKGVSLASLLKEHTLGFAPCGGHGRCGKCRVIATGDLSPVTPAEKAHLTGQELSEGFRLSCCTHIEGDCTVQTAYPDGTDRIRTDGTVSLSALHPLFTHYGAVIDIGTTTLAACLYDRDGQRLAEAGRMNPQSAWGADVISRIEAQLGGETDRLRAVTLRALDELLSRMVSSAHIRPDEVDGLVITGNTVMLHLLTGTSTEPLSHAPFEAERLFGEYLTAGELGITAIGSSSPVFLPPCVAAFIGADTVTALLASRMTESDGTSLLADIGTNGEMALWHEGHLSFCSTAAGPAFEGAGISMGMSGKDGAVDHVTLTDDGLSAHVIGDTSPVGICGSGLIDAVACLLDAELLDETGSLDEDPTVIADPVCLTQKDIRMVQLAKSAICAGIRTLMKEAHLPLEALSRILIAGGFGSFLNVACAGRIGLLPEETVPRVRSIGNAALAGAAMLLLNRDSIRSVSALLEQAHVVDLSANPIFADEYMNGMLFE